MLAVKVIDEGADTGLRAGERRTDRDISIPVSLPGTWMIAACEDTVDGS